jgi:hypothetical protein
MAAVATHGWRLVAAAAVLAACGRPAGMDSEAAPLAQIRVLVTGILPAPEPGDAELDAGTTIDARQAIDGGAPPGQLHAALVWGMQWLPEPFCVLPPESPRAAAVINAGCRDNFGFVPDRVAADALVTPGVPATLDLRTLPAADVMVGDVTARVAYGSVIVYEDRNDNGILDLRHPARQRQRHHEESDDGAGPADRVWGASFVSMTQPDRRVAFREGDFDENLAFYPRKGCAAPPKGFSILSASGFSETGALASLVTGELPLETDPQACAAATLDDTIEIPLQDPAGLSQLACTANDSGGVTYYRPAPTDVVPLDNFAWTCASFPRIGRDAPAGAAGQQLVIGSRPESACKSTLHLTLRGCDNDPFCAVPDWDLTPPAWWPCAATP